MKKFKYILQGINHIVFFKCKRVLIVTDVPAQICRLCGEEWFMSDVSLRLDELAEDIRGKGSEVEILSYGKAAVKA